MAIRIRKDCVKQFQVYWTNPYTKKRESVFCTTLPEAQKTDAQVKYRLQWEKETFRPADTQEKEEETDTTFGAVLYAYIREKQLPAYDTKTLLYHTGAFVKMFGTKDVNCITASDLSTAFMNVSKGVKVVTAVKLMKILKTIMRWAFKRKLLKAMPEWPEMPHAEYERFIPPTQEEVARMLAVAAPHIQRVIVIGSRIGVRIGRCELLKLKWSDVDWRKASISVHAARKNVHEPIREVPIASDIMPLLKKWYMDDMQSGAEHIIHYCGRQVVDIHGAWETMLARSGITRRIRPYDLRHAFATELIAGGADIGTVARLMGHTDVTMVLKTYQHVMTKQKVAAIECLPPLPMCHDECATIIQ